MADWWQALAARRPASGCGWPACLWRSGHRDRWCRSSCRTAAWWSNFSTGAKPTVVAGIGEAVVGTWSAACRGSCTLLWSSRRLRPASTLACENSTALNDEVPWQASQARRGRDVLGRLRQRAPRWLPRGSWRIARRALEDALMAGLAAHVLVLAGQRSRWSGGRRRRRRAAAPAPRASSAARASSQVDSQPAPFSRTRLLRECAASTCCADRRRLGRRRPCGRPGPSGSCATNR